VVVVLAKNPSPSEQYLDTIRRDCERGNFRMTPGDSDVCTVAELSVVSMTKG